MGSTKMISEEFKSFVLMNYIKDCLLCIISKNPHIINANFRGPKDYEGKTFSNSFTFYTSLNVFLDFISVWRYFCAF